jgi:1,4-dihydroxy-2-naphthoate octaprenyltransferase
MVTSIQLTAHYANEYFDREADRLISHRTFFSGGSGVISSGILAPTVALNAARTTSLVAGAMALLFLAVRPGAGLIGLIGLAVAWFYSAPPPRLLGTGWGEAVTSFTTAALLPYAGCLIQGGELGPPLLWSTGVLVLLHISMMLAFELPDLESDRIAGKQVLGVRLGPERTLLLMLGLMAVAAVVVAAAIALGFLPTSAAWAALAILPAAVCIAAAKRGSHALSTTAAVTTLGVVAIALMFALAG